MHPLFERSFFLGLVLGSAFLVGLTSCLLQRTAFGPHHSLHRADKPHYFMTSPSTLDSELDQETLTKLLDVAIDATKQAGNIIKEHAGGSKVEKTKANSRDLLTLIDPLCEKTIQEVVTATFPSHRFLGEESVPPGKEASTAAIERMLAEINQSDFLWIVDPIDGTTNFVHSLPFSAPSVAVAYKGEVVVGAIYDCHRDELFTAKKGHGAQMNGRRIQVGQQTSLSEAIVAMGSPPAEESMEMSMRGVQKLMPMVRSLRMIGSAALMLAWVANGRFTCYWEYDLSSWDLSGRSMNSLQLLYEICSSKNIF